MEPTGRLGIQPLDSPNADERLPALAEDARYGSMHMALPDGSVLPAGWAGAAVSTWLPGLHWIGWVAARVPGAGRALDWVYWQVAERRGRLSGLVPDVDAVERPGTPDG